MILSYIFTRGASGDKPRQKANAVSDVGGNDAGPGQYPGDGIGRERPDDGDERIDCRRERRDGENGRLNEPDAQAAAATASSAIYATNALGTKYESRAEFDGKRFTKYPRWNA